MSNKFFRRLISYFLNGLLLALPMIITGYVVYRTFTWLDQLMPIQHRYPGVGILILLLTITALGWMGSKFINDTIRRWFNAMLDRIPLIKTIYKSVTDLLGAFVGQKKSFNKPVLVKINHECDIEAIGFVTDDDLKELGHIDNKVGVYFPMSYSFAGHLMIVPAKNVRPIDRNAVDIMKYIVSGGVVDLDTDSDAKK